MELKILGSGSKGNCYILDNGKEALVIECGIPFGRVKKAMDFDISRIKGALVSHEHGDHSQAIVPFLTSFIPVYMSAGTAEVMDLQDEPEVVMMPTKTVFLIGNFKVMAFHVFHDAAEPYGFLVYHQEMGTMLFATDTRYLRHEPLGHEDVIRFPEVNNILIECNYRQDILEANVASGRLFPQLAKRTQLTHCSFDECKAILLHQDLTKVNNIVLIHLSDGNGNAEEFKADMEAATGKTVTIARPGTTIKNFNLSPF